MTFKELPNGIIISIDGSVYSENVIHKCFYWYTGSYNITIQKSQPPFYDATLLFSSDEKVEIEPLINSIKKDLIDFKVRDIISEKTQTIRELIIATAFAHYDTSEDPETEIEDPVGFDINAIK